MADNISLNKSSIDLTNNKQESIIVENISYSTANVTLTNSVSGVEWSDDAGQNWNTGGDSFMLGTGGDTPPLAQAFYEFDGDLTADSSGNSKTLTNNGVSLTTDRFSDADKAALFDNTESDYMEIPQVFSSTTEFSFCAWLKSTAVAGGYQWFFEQDADGFASYYRTLGNEFLAQVSSNTGAVTASHTVTDITDWHHVVVTAKAGGNLKLYVDGVLEANAAGVGNFLDGGTNKRVLGIDRSITAGRYYNGKMDDVRIYTKELSQTEITDIYKYSIYPSTKTYLFKHDSSLTTLSIPSQISFSSDNTEDVFCDVKPTNDFGVVAKGVTSSSFTLRVENIDTITRTVSSIVAPTGFEVKKSSESTWSSSISSFDITSSSYEDIDFRSNTSQIGDISEAATLSYNPTISIGLLLTSLSSDFKVEYIDSHVDNAKGRLIRQYRQGSNVEDICGALVGPLQTSEDDLFGLYSMLDIDTMTGVNLDRIGAIIGQERGGYNDENYRTFLKARVKINNSTGTIDEIVELWNLFNPGETIEVREQFPAQIELLTTAERPSTDIENAIYNLMYESKQAGVRLVWIIPYTVEGDGIFKFDSTNSADQFDSGVFNRILHD